MYWFFSTGTIRKRLCHFIRLLLICCNRKSALDNYYFGTPTPKTILATRIPRLKEWYLERVIYRTMHSFRFLGKDGKTTVCESNYSYGKCPILTQFLAHLDLHSWHSWFYESKITFWRYYEVESLENLTSWWSKIDASSNFRLVSS